MNTAIMGRGQSIRILGLPHQLRVKFARAIRLSGARSQSSWLLRMAQNFVLEVEGQHGDLFAIMTPDEHAILAAVRLGANDPDHIARETMIPMAQLEPLLNDLVERGVLEIRKQGGKTDVARGARRALYFVTEKYQSKQE